MLRRAHLPVPAHIGEDDEIHAMPQFEAYQAGELTDAEYMRLLAAYLGGLPVGQAEEIHLSMLIEPYPGVLEIVEELNAAGIVTGCLSNTNAPHWQDLALNGRFPAVVAMKIKLASFAIDAAKPDSAAFRAFEQACGYAPEAIVLFDDSLINCQAAEALGWSALRIDPAADPARQMRGYLRR
jgi:putative hydrolase of the HAD superfamily